MNDVLRKRATVLYVACVKACAARIEASLKDPSGEPLVKGEVTTGIIVGRLIPPLHGLGRGRASVCRRRHHCGNQDFPLLLPSSGTRRNPRRNTERAEDAAETAVQVW